MGIIRRIGGLSSGQYLYQNQDQVEPPSKSFGPGPKPNPRPKGLVVGGSSTEEVRDFLEERQGTWFTKGQIHFITKRTPKSIDWALIYLRQLGQIEVSGDLGRNPRYLKYRWVATLKTGQK